MKWLFALFALTFFLSCDDDDPPPLRTDSFGAITMKVDDQTVVMKAPHKLLYTDYGYPPQETFSIKGASCDLEIESSSDFSILLPPKMDIIIHPSCCETRSFFVLQVDNNQ